MELIFLSEDWRLKAQAEQFNREPDDCAEWSDDKREKLKDFLARYPINLRPANLSLNPDDLSKTDYFSLANILNRYLLSNTFANAAPTEIDATMPLIFWLVDDKEAVFAIPAYDEESPTLGFKTSDRNLILGLKKMSKPYRKRHA